MDLKEHLQKVRSLSANITQQALQSVFVPAASKLLAVTKNRIIRQGTASDGSTIGSYSTKASYYNRNAFIRKSAFKPIGKTGQRQFKNGKPHKSMFVPTGYSGLRELQGRETGFVNVQYSGDLLLDYQQEVRKTEIVQGFTKRIESDKRKGLEKKYGKAIFGSNAEHIEAYKVEVITGLKNITLNTLR